jgi:hypothetical protein
MSTLPAVTMQDLELEHAELLPSRETLWCCHPKHGGSSGSGGGASFTNVGTGNVYQSGNFLPIAIGGGNFDNNVIVVG